MIDKLPVCGHLGIGILSSLVDSKYHQHPKIEGGKG